MCLEDTHLLSNHALFEMPGISVLKKWHCFFPSCFPMQGKEEHKTNTGMQRCDILTKLLAKSGSLFSHLSQQDPVLMCSVKEHISL